MATGAWLRAPAARLCRSAANMAPAASVSALPSRMKKLVPNASHPRCASRWTTGIEVRRGSTCMLALCWVYQPRCGWDGAERRLSSKARVTVDDEAMQYEKKTQLEHVLHRPDVYVGSMEETERQMLVFDMKARKVEFRAIKYIPGLLKLFDEIIVNAADNKVRDPTMNRIDVKIDEKNGVVSIWNNGKGIPIIRHAQYQDIYVPELVMGNLLAGSNFDDSKKRLGGGRHGYGAKLTNIFSTTFTVETADTIRKLRYRQTWRDNMSTCEPAVITPLGDETKDFTEITFAVDLRRFSRKTKLDKDIVALWARRVLDVAGCNPGVRCSLNGKPVRVKGTADLAHKYLSAIEATRRAEPDAKADRAGSIVELADASGRWSAAIAAGGSGLLNSVSYVNSIWTARGGTHVKYIADKVIEQILGHIKKNHKDLDVTDRQVRAHLWVCLAASVENPSFDSQSKELLTTSPEAFGSKFILRPADIRKIINHTGLVARVVQAAEGKMGRDLDKSTAAVAKRASSGKRLLIPKLEDANWAGTSKGHECTLILTEGDSAKALAVSGLSVLGRDRYGVFPLKGKLLNVREASHGQVRDNVEFTAIKTILGLQHGSSYHKDRDVGDKAFRSLRYGRVMLMTDQDHDGSHIKGLFFNMIHHFWPELLQRNDFICEFVTPIVKCFARQPAAAPPARAANAGSKGKGAAGSGDGVAAEGRQEKAFFTLQEFSAWWERLGGAEKSRWRVKYYKGLGTSSATEGKEYFADLAQHKLDMTHKGASDDDALQLAFSGNADRRKEWLLAHVASMEASRSTLDVVDHSASQLRYFDFVHKELIQFSYAHVRRSIPSVIDGFKPGNRKVIYACFKRRLIKEIKVAQLAGFVAEHTAYHHGEASLHGTIVKMAQRFVGTNNLPLLEAAGQFGTRLQGGEDAASPRYIFTQLSPFSRMLMPEKDDALLEHLHDDGVKVEPVFFVPIVPTILLNGAEGIATGWSTNIPMYNPLHVIDAVAACIRAGAPSALGAEWEALPELIPWYRGFRGDIEPLASGDGYETHGCVSLVTNRVGVRGRTGKKQAEEAEEEGRGLVVQVSELPVGRWTEDFLNTLNKLSAEEGVVESFRHDNTEALVDTRVRFAASAGEWLLDDGGNLKRELVRKTLKLTTRLSTKNMYAFSPTGAITQYNDPRQIITEFVPVRRALYARRKQREEALIGSRLLRLSNQGRFLELIAQGKFIFGGKRKEELEAELEQLGFLDEAQVYSQLHTVGVIGEASGRRDQVEDKEGAVESDGTDDGAGLSLASQGAGQGEVEGTDGGMPRGAGTDADRGGVLEGKGKFGYLLGMPLWNATMERRTALGDQEVKAREELDVLRRKSVDDIWLAELDEFRATVSAFLANA